MARGIERGVTDSAYWSKERLSYWNDDSGFSTASLANPQPSKQTSGALQRPLGLSLMPGIRRAGDPTVVLVGVFVKDKVQDKCDVVTRNSP